MFRSRFHQVMRPDWLQRLELCSTANGWKEEAKAVKLPTLLEGEALAVWLDLNEDEKTTTYDLVKKCLIETLMPMGFTVPRLVDYTIWRSPVGVQS